MTTRHLILGFFVFAVNIAKAQRHFRFQLFAGFSQSNLDWTIAGNGAGKNPNVLSALDWNSLKGPNLGFSLGASITKKIDLQFAFVGAPTKWGNASDFDYAADNRQDLVYEDYFNSNRGFISNLETGLVYWLFKTGDFSFATSANYFLLRNNAYLLPSNAGAEQEGLYSNYKNQWQGAEVGVKIAHKWKVVETELNLAFGLLDYEAAARWNLIGNFAQSMRFRHAANGQRYAAGLSSKYHITEALAFGMNFRYVYAQANAGVDKAYYQNGTQKQTRLNEVNLDNRQISMAFSYAF